MGRPVRELVKTARDSANVDNSWDRLIACDRDQILPPILAIGTTAA
jgi:hypothetical protein